MFAVPVPLDCFPQQTENICTSNTAHRKADICDLFGNPVIGQKHARLIQLNHLLWFGNNMNEIIPSYGEPSLKEEFSDLYNECVEQPAEIVIPQDKLLKGIDSNGTKVTINSTNTHWLEKQEDLYVYNVRGVFDTDASGNVTNPGMVCQLIQDRMNEICASNSVTSFDFDVYSGIQNGKYVQRIQIKFKTDEPEKQQVSSVVFTGSFQTRDATHKQPNFGQSTNLPGYYTKTTSTDTPEQKCKTTVGCKVTRITPTPVEIGTSTNIVKNTVETAKFPKGVEYFDLRLPSQVSGQLNGNTKVETIPTPVSAVYKKLDQTKTTTRLVHYGKQSDSKYFQKGTNYYKLNFAKVRTDVPQTADIFSGPMSRKDMKTDDWRNIKGKCFIGGVEQSATGREEKAGSPIVEQPEKRQNSAIVIIKNGKQVLTHLQEVITQYGSIEQFEADIKKNGRTVYQAPSVYRNNTYNPSLSDDYSGYHRYLIEEKDGSIGIIEIDFGSQSVSSRGVAQAINTIIPTTRIVYLDTGLVKQGSPANNPQQLSNEGFVCGVVISGQ